MRLARAALLERWAAFLCPLAGLGATAMGGALSAAAAVTDAVLLLLLPRCPLVRRPA